ncbi:MAG: GPW/gp25 family protein [Caulobacter sp.]|nr:GPW/gp25 family protein [Caulobacter sp.]
MIGLSASTGGPLEGDAHLAQSIADILTTPIGTRVCRRDYGSLFAELIDQPFNALTRIRLYAATALALRRWEPRITLRQVSIAAGAAAGSFVLELVGVRAGGPTANTLTRLTVPLRAGAAVL